MTQTGWIDQTEALAEQSVLPMLAELIGARQVDHWFRGKTRFAVVAHELIVTVSNSFMQNWLAMEYRPALQHVARTITGNANAVVTFSVGGKTSSAAQGQPAQTHQSVKTHGNTEAPRSLPRTPESIKPIPPIATTLPMVGVATPLVYGLPASSANPPALRSNTSSSAGSFPGKISVTDSPRPLAGRESDSRPSTQFLNTSVAMLAGKAVSTPTTVGTSATAAGTAAVVPAPTVAAAPVSAGTAPVAETPRHRVGRRFLELREFVVGPCNQLAFAMAQHVGNSPGEPSNPLFIYGTCGNGKTHLAEGIYRLIKRQHPQLNVQFLTAAAFTNSFTQGIRERSMPTFRQRFRSIDVLIVDDIEFFDGKPGVQEEFLAQVKQLLAGGKQVVVTADRHPRLLSRFSDVLQSLFLSGAIVRIENPDLETRRKIVVQKSSRMEIRLTPEALDLVAQRFSRNVRELEGALNCLQAHYLAHKQPIGVTLSRQILGELERDCVRVVTVADIEHVVCQVFGITLEDLRSGSRTRTLSEPRALAMYLARSLTRCTYSAIGTHFGKRNHSTVVAAERRIATAIAERSSIRIAARNWTMDSLVESLRQQLLAG